MIYHMLYGKQPFNGENDDEIYDNILMWRINCNDEEWDNISSDAKDLINK